MNQFKNRKFKIRKCGINMNETSDEIKNFWIHYCTTITGQNEKDCGAKIPDAWSFGDSPEMADDLLNYVLSGEKTTTSGMLLDFEHDKDPIPKSGDKAIILNGAKEPVCIIEYIKVEQKKYNEVDEEYALKEAEGFKSLQDWKDVQWAFFTRRCEVLGIEMHEEVILVCLEFKKIYSA